jgi:hypothetical protein
MAGLCGNRKNVWFYTYLVVETLNARRKSQLGAEPLQDELLMRAQHPGDFVHRFKAAAQSALAPIIEKGSGPDHRLVPFDGVDIVAPDCTNVSMSDRGGTIDLTFTKVPY